MNDEQLFDKPVEAFLADNNLFKWLKSTESVARSLETVTEPIADADREKVLATIKSVLASWDPNHGSDHDESLRVNLEMQLSAISEQILASLPASQRDSIRAEQKTELGYGYIFVAPLDELTLSEHQKTELRQLSKQVEEEADTATRQEMDRIQIRNPQAYLAYKLAKRYEQLRKSRLTHGREFYEHSLSDEQRKHLNLKQ